MAQKIDCTLTENFFVERKRMCNSFSNCEDNGGCPLSNSGKTCLFTGMSSRTLEEIKNIIACVQKWSDENPQKTYLEDLLSKYPEAPLGIKGTPEICVAGLYKNFDVICDCTVCCNCWNRVML